MNSRIQQLKVAATFMAQAQILCDGVRELLGDDAEHLHRLDKIRGALREEFSYIDQLVTAIKGPLEGETSSPGAASAPNAEPSRIEALNAELLECERLNQQLDELTATFETASGEGKTSEDIILKSNADYAEKRLLDRIDTLATCLALERPTTARDTLIFALRALAPLQEVMMAVSEEHSYERKQGAIALRLLQGIIPALEELAGVTRSGLGFEEPPTEAEIIAKLKAAVAQQGRAD